MFFSPPPEPSLGKLGSQEGCLLHLRFSLWFSDLPLFYSRRLSPSLSFSHHHSGLLFPILTTYQTPGLGRSPGGGHGNPLQYYTHGQRTLVGYSPWGCKELDTTEQLSTARCKWRSLEADSVAFPIKHCLSLLSPLGHLPLAHSSSLHESGRWYLGHGTLRERGDH